jgi:hypothetical protein
VESADVKIDAFRSRDPAGVQALSARAAGHRRKRRCDRGSRAPHAGNLRRTACSLSYGPGLGEANGRVRKRGSLVMRFAERRFVKSRFVKKRFVEIRFVKKRFVEIRFAEIRFVEKRFVESHPLTNFGDLVIAQGLALNDLSYENPAFS